VSALFLGAIVAAKGDAPMVSIPKFQPSKPGIHIPTSRVSVPNFQPSKSGFHFINAFENVPDINISAPVIGNVGIGSASNGLCGGMVFAVRDYFESNLAVPPDTTPPTDGQLFDYIVMRLFDSFNLDQPTTGLARYMQLMDPQMSDASRASVMINDEWPKVKADIDSGHLSPLALIKIQSLNAGDHQVLAYGYDLSPTELVIHLYDPNEPGIDNVTLSLGLLDRVNGIPVTFSGGGTVFCFFQPAYKYEDVANGGFANAEKWKSNLSAAVNIGAAVITGGLSWLVDSAIKLFASIGNKPLLVWNQLNGQTLPGNYHIVATFDQTAPPGTVLFALKTDKNSFKKQVAFQFWDPKSAQFHNLFFANNFAPDKSPGAPEFQTSTAPPLTLDLVETGCFEFDSQDSVGGLPGRFILGKLDQQLKSGTRVTFFWQDIN
jgi:hypothetical protein